MHACSKWVYSYKALHQSVLDLSQKWDYEQLHSNHGKVLRMCWFKALSIPGGLRLYLFKQVLDKR